MTDHTSEFNSADVAANKSISVLSYIGILCLIPMFSRKTSPYARYHANQGLVLFITEILFSFVRQFFNFLFDNSILSLIMIPMNTVFAIVSILLLVFMVMGIINCIYGTAKDLPLIGKVRILK